MSVDRPTFHEAWHRIAGLTPRLRPGVRIQRVVFRGEHWYVLQDPGSGQLVRINRPAYQILGLLDGRTTVASAWERAMTALGDEAPTQGEALNLLGQLAGANLLAAEVPGETAALLRRLRRRTTQALVGRLTGVLAVRIPLVDPDRFLERLARPLGWMVSPLGALVWFALLGAGLWSLAGRWRDLTSGAGGALAPENLPWLYACLVCVKLLHELGHALACKVLGRRAGTGGEVRTLGVMLLVFVPLPYVDASGAWLLKSKWERALVGAGGMIVEVALAALAAIVWARTAEGTLVHALAANIMLIAGVSTVLFNANPLLRYDGYYILCDLLEVPNLAQRSGAYLAHLVKRRVWGVRRAAPPVVAPGERAGLVGYAITSHAYRLAVTIAIVLVVAQQWFIIGVALAVMTAVIALGAPVARLTAYLATDPELDRVRGRAMATTLGACAALVLLLGGVPVPERIRLEGRVEAIRSTAIAMPHDGVILQAPEFGARILATDTGPLLAAYNPELDATVRTLEARARGAEARWRRTFASDPARAKIDAGALDAVRGQLDEARARQAALRIAPPHDGVWLPASEAGRVVGRRVARGQTVGTVVDPTSVRIRAEAGQDALGVVAATGSAVELRVPGHAGRVLGGRIERVVEAGRRREPGPEPADPAGAPRERRFGVSVTPEAALGLAPGQSVMVRVELGRTPLLVQWARAVRRVFQERFQA